MLSGTDPICFPHQVIAVLNGKGFIAGTKCGRVDYCVQNGGFPLSIFILKVPITRATPTLCKIVFLHTLTVEIQFVD